MHGAEKQGVMHHFLSLFVRTPPVLAWASLERLVSPLSHANKVRNFPSRRRPCWRRPPWKVLIHRRATPTSPGFSHAGAARVGVGLSGKACCTVEPRQQGPEFPEPAPPVLAWASLESLDSPSSHANKHPSCFRRINPSAFSGNFRTPWCPPSR